VMLPTDPTTKMTHCKATRRYVDQSISEVDDFVVVSVEFQTFVSSELLSNDDGRLVKFILACMKSSARRQQQISFSYFDVNDAYSSVVFLLVFPCCKYRPTSLLLSQGRPLDQ